MHTHSIIHSHTHKYARIYKQRDCTYAGMILTCFDVSVFSLCLSRPPHLPVFSRVHAPTHALCNLSPHSSCSVCSGLFVALHTTPSSRHESPKICRKPFKDVQKNHEETSHDNAQVCVAPASQSEFISSFAMRHPSIEHMNLSSQSFSSALLKCQVAG